MAKCFVIGPIGDTGSVIRASADDFMKYIVTPVVTNNEFDYENPIRADSLNEPGRITSQIVALLMEAELVIADLTTNNANVFYELSLRHAVGKPVIHMAEEGTPLSFDVRDNRTIFYTMHSRTAEAARDELAKQIRHVRKPGYKAMNPILETVGIINLERSTDPQQVAIGQLMGMVERVNNGVLDIQQQMKSDALTAPFGIPTITTGLARPVVMGAGTSPSILGKGGTGRPLGLLGVTDEGVLSGFGTATPDSQGARKKK